MFIEHTAQGRGVYIRYSSIKEIMIREHEGEEGFTWTTVTLLSDSNEEYRIINYKFKPTEICPSHLSTAQEFVLAISRHFASEDSKGYIFEDPYNYFLRKLSIKERYP